MTKTMRSKVNNGKEYDENPSFGGIYTFLIFLVAYPVITWPFAWAILNEKLFPRFSDIVIFFGMGILYFFVCLPISILLGLYFAVRIRSEGWFSVPDAIWISFLIGMFLRVPQWVWKSSGIEVPRSFGGIGSYLWQGLPYAILAVTAVLLIRCLLIVVGLSSKQDPSIVKATP